MALRQLAQLTAIRGQAILSTDSCGMPFLMFEAQVTKGVHGSCRCAFCEDCGDFLAGMQACSKLAVLDACSRVPSRAIFLGFDTSRLIHVDLTPVLSSGEAACKKFSNAHQQKQTHGARMPVVATRFI